MFPQTHSRMFAQNKYCIHFQEVDVSALSSYATIQELIKLKLFWLYGLLLFYLLGSSDIYELYFWLREELKECLCLFDTNLSSDYKINTGNVLIKKDY